MGAVRYAGGMGLQSGGQVGRIDAVRSVDQFRWVSAPQGVPHGTDRTGAVYKGRGEEMVIRVGARQIKALTPPNCLIGAGRIRGS